MFHRESKTIKGNLHALVSFHKFPLHFPSFFPFTFQRINFLPLAKMCEGDIFSCFLFSLKISISLQYWNMFNPDDRFSQLVILKASSGAKEIYSRPSLIYIWVLLFGHLTNLSNWWQLVFSLDIFCLLLNTCKTIDISWILNLYKLRVAHSLDGTTASFSHLWQFK